MAMTRHEPFLGRKVRSGTWVELAQGTYRVVLEAVRAGEWEVVRDLLPVSILEAAELHDVFGQWPAQIVEWMLLAGVSVDEVESEQRCLWGVIGDGTEPRWEESWSHYVELTDQALRLAEQEDAGTYQAVLEARDRWQVAHDQAVDLIYGLLDVAIRLLGEECLPDVWNYLMSDWYDDHAQRLSLSNQTWSESARQLALATVDGFHAHLSGVDRLGDMELIEQSDRTGFRFAPCGSGGRVMRDDTTDGHPRMEPPFGFSVTTEPHDWSFGSAGVCSYCVHCCLLNMTMPIDRLGYPTRVIEPPIWPAAREGGTCTWWVYRDPSLVPDAVFHQVGRSPERRPTGGKASG